VLVTDSFFTRHTPWIAEYLQAAEALGIATIVFDGGLPDPTTTLCDEATARVREALRGQSPDHVIALGGGSNIDLAKALCLTLPGGRPVRDFVGDIGGCRPLPLIALPTTSGTGSEATPGAILLDPANATKVAVMDRACRDGKDAEARIGMAYASIYAALSYGSAGLNAVHGIAYAVAGQTHKSHGSTNAVMLPYVLDAMRDVRRSELLEVARMFGIPTADEGSALRAVPVAVRDLIGRLGIPTDLHAFGVREEDLAALTQDAIGVTRLAKAFPVDDVPASYCGMVAQAFRGRLSGRHEQVASAVQGS
jgi:alcohol dehydrogenase class IV